MDYRFKSQGRRLSNWGRWGEDDEKGTLNFLAPEVVTSALASARQGRTFELSTPIENAGPHRGAGNRNNPVHLMNIMPPDFSTDDDISIADDYIMMPLQSTSQWDSLAHVGYDGLLYNGFSNQTIKVLGGASRNSIDRTLPGFTGRGVLLDIARLNGVDWLSNDHRIEPAELERAEQEQGVTLRRGDALLFRTGMRLKALQTGWDGWLDAEPGLTPECADWIHERELATVASDNWGIEVQPAAEGFLPLHCVLIRDMGMMLGEIWDLEELATDCASDGQWDFFLVAPALRVTGGVGSPVSPVAIK